jgi:hypothetical protein
MELSCWIIMFRRSVKQFKFGNRFSDPFFKGIYLVCQVRLKLSVLLSSHFFELIKNFIEVFFSSIPKFKDAFLSCQPLVLNRDIWDDCWSKLSCDLVSDSVVYHYHEFSLVLWEAKHFRLVPNLLLILRKSFNSLVICTLHSLHCTFNFWGYFLSFSLYLAD